MLHLIVIIAIFAYVFRNESCECDYNTQIVKIENGVSPVYSNNYNPSLDQVVLEKVVIGIFEYAFCNDSYGCNKIQCNTQVENSLLEEEVVSKTVLEEEEVVLEEEVVVLEEEEEVVWKKFWKKKK